MSEYGTDTDIGLGFQTAWDTEVSDVGSFHFIPFVSENVGLEIPHKISENMRGIFDEGESYDGPKTVAGDLEAEAQPIVLGAFFKSMFNLASSVVSDGIYTHTFLPRTADASNVSAQSPLTYYKNLSDGGSATLFYNLNATNLELGISNGELLTVKASVVGGNFKQIAAVTASYEEGKRWSWDVASVSIDGSANVDLQEATLTFDESLEANHTLNGSKFPSSVSRSGFRSAVINGTMIFKDQTEYQKFVASSEQNFTISLRGTTEIQSGYYEDLTFTYPQMRYETFKPEAGGPGKITVGFTGRGKYNTTSVTACIITLVNTQATY